MNTDAENSKTPLPPMPDDRLREITEPKSDDGGSVLPVSALAGFVLLKLHGYQKPPLAEELSDPEGAEGGCSCNSVCSCVPVQTCACDSVCACDTVTEPPSASGGGGGGGGSGYWAPCF